MRQILAALAIFLLSTAAQANCWPQGDNTACIDEEGNIVVRDEDGDIISITHPEDTGMELDPDAPQPYTRVDRHGNAIHYTCTSHGCMRLD